MSPSIDQDAETVRKGIGHRNVTDEITANEALDRILARIAELEAAWPESAYKARFEDSIRERDKQARRIAELEEDLKYRTDQYEGLAIRFDELEARELEPRTPERDRRWDR